MRLSFIMIILLHAGYPVISLFAVRYMLTAIFHKKQTTVDSHYLEVKRILWNTSRYQYFDISDLQNWGKYQSNNQISQMNM